MTPPPFESVHILRGRANERAALIWWFGSMRWHVSNRQQRIFVERESESSWVWRSRREGSQLALHVREALRERDWGRSKPERSLALSFRACLGSRGQVCVSLFCPQTINVLMHLPFPKSLLPLCAIFQYKPMVLLSPCFIVSHHQLLVPTSCSSPVAQGRRTCELEMGVVWKMHSPQTGFVGGGPSMDTKLWFCT